MIALPTKAFENPPIVVWDHIDGPMLHWACHVHWLTWRERFMLWLGLTDIETITCKHWPQRRQFLK